MAITAGNYIIHSALGEDIVLLISGGSKSKGAVVTAGAMTEADNRCYWKTAIESTNFNKIYNINSGTKTGYVMSDTIASGKTAIQGAYKKATGAWLATASGNTMTVNGQTVSTYFLKAYNNNSLYLTVPNNGGNLYLSALLDDTANQEFYFEPTTYYNAKLATPSNIQTTDGKSYIIASGVSSFTPQWNCTKTDIIYERRYRSRRYDMTGTPEDWGSWTAWTQIVAEKQVDAKKKYIGVMKAASSVPTPNVNNVNWLQADVQVEVRLTSAKTAAAYNQTGTVTHGPTASTIISQWKAPAVTLLSAVCTQYGLEVQYAIDYTVAGNLIRFVSVVNGSTEILRNYTLTNQDYEGTLIIDWDRLKAVPSAGDTLAFTVYVQEANGFVSGTSIYSLSVTYDDESGFAITPTYSVTDRLTIEASLPEYDSIECYMKRTDLEGNEDWIAVEEIAGDGTHRVFEIIPPINTAPTLMWVVHNTSGGNTQWGCSTETLGTAYALKSQAFAWNWVDDGLEPHAFILKYRANATMQPNDNITLPANKYITTGRDYPIFRYTKTIERVLDIEGAILDVETGAYSTRAVAETLAKADHCVYRQPDGKWYQVAIKTLSFTRENKYCNVSIGQEAESR